jgi:hypothetical protein
MNVLDDGALSGMDLTAFPCDPICLLTVSRGRV